jgi:intraflagellar transport protein 80
LALARTYNVHLDTVLAYRKRYLETAGLEEINSKFIELSNEVTVDWKSIKDRIKDEKLKENNI